MMEKALARRARELEYEKESIDVVPVSADVLEGLREALLGGETHYTDRPGMKALRERIGEKLGRDADSVVITAGAREARYVIELSGSDAPVVDIGDRLSPPADRPDAILIGTLDALPGLRSFRVAFVAAPAGLGPKLKSWKQALSICTAAPSQRAALLLWDRDEA